MRAAIIGLGVIGKVHARVLREMNALYAVCDVDAEKFADYPDAKQETDYIRLLDELKPDVVHICTPHYLHADMVIEALKRNINVLCEKPLCIHVEDIDRILEAEKASRAQLGVCMQNRYNAANLFAKEYLKDKKVLSGVGQVAWNRDASYYASGEWRGKWATEGGGVLINQALHTLDILEWLVGVPTKLTASISNLSLQNEIEVEDTAVIRAFDGASLTFFATNGSGNSMPVEVVIKTEDTVVRILPDHVIVGNEATFFKKDERHVFGKSCYGSGHAPLIADFYDCISTGRQFALNGEEASRVVRLILAAYRSNGATVEI
ncbi:MAG: Gfo/Idh/MocA family oxidoreductase [Clostridia bacterium]|nr:Gfo/Idh/MocA family oxidoreductase [Clostridia bacterium]